MVAEQKKQRNTRENNTVDQMIRAEVKEFTPNRIDGGKEHDEITLIDNENDMEDKDNENCCGKEGKWMGCTKKHVPIEKSLKKQNIEIKKTDINNRCEGFTNDDEEREKKKKKKRMRR